MNTIGSKVRSVQVGDKVFGCAGGVGDLGGALCDYMIADEDLVAPMLASLDFIEAAALPLVSITAWEGLVSKAGITAGDHILVHGGAGGVGHIALQLAKLCGGKVAATVSSEAKAQIARDLGADNIIFYKEEAVEYYVERLTAKRGFDIVFDTVSGDALAANNGNVVAINNPTIERIDQAYRKGLSIHFVMMLLPMQTGVGRKDHGRILRNIAMLVDDGHLRPLLDQKTFRFSEAKEAHEYFQSGGAIGKIVLEND